MLGHSLPFTEQESRILSENEGEFPKITFLYHWCHGHYREGSSPMMIFLDLIGHPDFKPTNPIFDNEKGLGFLELDYLGEALIEYTEKGESARLYVSKLITLMEDNND